MSDYDDIVIGSGFGGSMAAYPLVRAGRRVLMLERGAWVSRERDSAFRAAGIVTSAFSRESLYDIVANGKRYDGGSYTCVGGQSVFYGGASYRFRESDFGDDPIFTGCGAAWPFGYDEIEPYYGMAEDLLGVAGTDDDPTAPRRSTPFPQAPAPLLPPANRIADAARRLGMRPTQIPLAIAFTPNGRRAPCDRCATCDGYACANEAKNDLATVLIPELVCRGMTLRANTVCTRLERHGARIVAAHCVDRLTGRRDRVTAERVLLAAGALATPHLLLASGLAHANPAGGAVGRFMTRHRNEVVLGVFERRPNPTRAFDKQVAVMDFYRAGSIQQWTPPEGVVRAYLSPVVGLPASVVLSFTLGLMIMAEDQPQARNHVALNGSVDRFGLPSLRVRHAYSARDHASARILVTHARQILREAGALFTFTRRVHTLSHALGTVRMGRVERTAPLDADGRYRGIENLYVTDGSALPRAAAVNPSLTIAANALRIGTLLARPARSAPGATHARVTHDS
jgi:choline dehydrogenase-like flavoprotein